MNRLRIICCNLLWFLSSLPGYIRFVFATRNVKRYQTKKLLRLLHKNRDGKYGRQHGFNGINSWHDLGDLPLTDYSDYRGSVEEALAGRFDVLTSDKVRILQPTSGTSSGPKLIPFTDSSADEFTAALDVWIVDLFIQRPKLLFGPQYWSISPSSGPSVDKDDGVPVGFLDDADYFGRHRRWIMNAIMAVPSHVGQIDDMSANRYVTLLFLLRQKELRLISVWHPSFLTILLRTARSTWHTCLRDLENGGIDSTIQVPEGIRQRLARQLRPVPSRARALKQLDPSADDLFQKVWPDLQVISCWRQGNVLAEIAELEKSFPSILIQGKGLLATEGVVTVPLGPSQQHVCAITSHVLEFQDEDDDSIFPAWNLRHGKSYRIILTTAAGLYRYQLNDRVEVTGFYRQAPCLHFLGRAGVVSDCVGEKLHIEHVEKIINSITSLCFHSTRFTVLVPPSTNGKQRYNFLVEKNGENDPDWNAVATSLESELCTNYHYARARQIGQLERVSVTLIEPNAQDRYRDFMIKQGAVAGTIKFPALCTVPGIEEHLIGVQKDALSLA